MLSEPACEGLIFDLDGTLLDTMPMHFVAWRDTLRVHGVEFEEDHFYSLGGMPAFKVVEHLARGAGLSLDAPAVARSKEELFIELTRDGVAPIAPVLEVVRRHEGRTPLAVGTGSPRWLAERLLGGAGLSRCFDAVVASEDTARHKPEPDVFLEAARRLGVRPEGCVVYEDADLGVEAARRAGMRVVDVRGFFTPRRVTPARGR